MSSIQAQNTTTDQSSLQDTNGGTVLDDSLTSLSGVNLTLDGTGTIATGQITSYTNGTLSLSAGTVSLSALTDIDGSAFQVSGGVTVTLPAITNASGSSFEVSGAASLTVPALTTYAGGNGGLDTLGGNGRRQRALHLPRSGLDYREYGLLRLDQGPGPGQGRAVAIARLDPAQRRGPFQLESDGTGSQLKVAALSQHPGSEHHNRPVIAPGDQRRHAARRQPDRQV